MTAQQYLVGFLEWERKHPNEPFRDWPGLVGAIKTALSDEAQLRALVGTGEQLRSLLQRMLDVAENADETEYVTDVGFVDVDKLHKEVRAALLG